MKKKIVCLLLATVLVFTLVACGSKKEEPESLNSNTTSDDDSNNSSDRSNLSGDSTDSDAPSTSELNLYHLDSEEATMTSELISLETTAADKITASDIISKLAEYGILNQELEFNTFNEETDEDNRSILILDMKSDFKDYLKELDAQKEGLIMQCIANTFIECYDADALLLTVDGETLETEHNNYSEALNFTETDGDTPLDDDTDVNVSPESENSDE